ncbi:probable GPI-anchored adhesin-like protein PGA55 isoform X2 [Stegodyphus dumicola]|uniref:probable GPI-anchored adhesin-like protein PGA55 isoform X2 n=1 Tax=Stegodyphus dumicola TaxID=202533 RepID=UPI0015A76260|nr:probable GPI-anchored adhesin-like protein PGA55 isoform X2 [Stegodyphus dumicola]
MEFGRFALAMVGHFIASLLYVLQKLHIVNAVVDTSSILEHREELRELWEKRMMADENQSSSSSTVAETTTKPVQEDDNEEKVAKSKSESDTNLQPKMANGVAKPIEDSKVEENDSANIIHDEEIVKSSEAAPVAPSAEVDHENNNSADSLEEDNNNDDFVEEKTYTSKLETSLVTKQVTQVSTETVVHSTTVEEQHISETVQESVQAEACSYQTVTSAVTSTTFEKCDSREAEINSSEPESLSAPSEEVVSSTQEVITEREVNSETSEEIVVHEETITSTSEEVIHQQEVVETVTYEPIKSQKPEPEKLTAEDEDDGFVRVEECLPQPDSTEDVQDLPSEIVGQDTDEQEITTTNGYDEHSRPSTTSPDLSISEDKPSHPEMEQFVKSGGLKRILPGVQKTEQPYNTCTTETKIAMEIREMREREEELRLMREQALLSPVVSPVPPKSPNARSPSPSQKEVHSPTPSSVGYRVSSVFGHKGTTSPSPPVDEEKKPFKGFSKESAVEKEIRIARDREEELRRQKGLPPREDDSYVKPSQVKNSQVRVFGKMAGTSNTSVKQAATAKIQMEIEEQTQREMALRETGHIQTISQERTDAKVAKMKTPDCTSPVTNGNSHPLTNGNYTNGRSSPDKRSTPSPTGAKPATIFSQNNGVPKGNISMHKFIASKGKETTFTASRNGGVFQPKEEVVTKAAVPPPMIKLKRNLSVESKIQQEIMEMKQREEELKKLHMNRNNENSTVDGKDIENEMNQKNNLVEYENGNGLNEEEISPRHNKLIAQWEQRIQKAES